MEPLTKGLPPPDPRSLCPLSSTEIVEPPRPEKIRDVNPRKKILDVTSPEKIPGYTTG
jgi:hypothetical protein